MSFITPNWWLWPRRSTVSNTKPGHGGSGWTGDGILDIIYGKEWEPHSVPPNLMIDIHEAAKTLTDSPWAYPNHSTGLGSYPVGMVLQLAQDLFRILNDNSCCDLRNFPMITKLQKGSGMNVCVKVRNVWQKTQKTPVENKDTKSLSLFIWPYIYHIFLSSSYNFKLYLLLALNWGPHLKKIHGSGTHSTAIPPRSVLAQLIPKESNNDNANSGNPNPNSERRIELPALTEAELCTRSA